MPKDDEPRGKHRARAGGNVPAATTFAGNLMALIAIEMLFDEDDNGENENEEPSQ